MTLVFSKIINILLELKIFVLCEFFREYFVGLYVIHRKCFTKLEKYLISLKFYKTEISRSHLISKELLLL